MAVLSFAKNKFPKFVSLSNTATPSAPGIFYTMDQKKLPHKKSTKNNNSKYQNKNC